MTSWIEFGRQVEQRAVGRCEYCKMHQTLQGATFHVEHIVPRSLGGSSELANLAWACPSCNLRKANRVEVLVPGFDEEVPLFNPRSQRWEDHFPVTLGSGKPLLRSRIAFPPLELTSVGQSGTGFAKLRDDVPRPEDH